MAEPGSEMRDCCCAGLVPPTTVVAADAALTGDAGTRVALATAHRRDRTAFTSMLRLIRTNQASPCARRGRGGAVDGYAELAAKTSRAQVVPRQCGCGQFGPGRMLQ